MHNPVILEPQAQQVSTQSSMPPLIFQLPPEQGRQVLEEAQSTPVFMYPGSIESTEVNTGAYGTIKVHLIKPEGLKAKPEVIFYIHGAGWVFGSLRTHEKLVRELAARTGCVVVFPEYSLSPEAKYPAAIEQCYGAIQKLPEILKGLDCDASLDRLTVAGDSVGGNMTTVMCLMTMERRGRPIHKQLMYYPVTNANFNTGSYLQFARGYYLYREGMMWFWNQYTRSGRDRAQITASPLRASISQLSGLPQAMIINGEADVLRDEGEAYARKLRQAGVEVTQMRLQGMIHDFVMLNSLDRTNACRCAMDASTQWIKRKNRD